MLGLVHAIDCVVIVVHCLYCNTLECVCKTTASECCGEGGIAKQKWQTLALDKNSKVHNCSLVKIIGTILNVHSKSEIKCSRIDAAMASSWNGKIENIELCCCKKCLIQV